MKGKSGPGLGVT